MQVLNASMNGTKPQQPSVTVHHPESLVKGIESFESVATIEGWLVSQLAERLELEALEIDLEEDFTNYGLNSIEAINLSGDLETILGRRLPPTLLWDYPNICTLAKYLADHNTLDITQYQNGISPKDAEHLLQHLDQLSDTDVDTLLNILLSEQEEIND
ncbi:acyl carrier protein [Planktothrix agardhii]|jgi:acyl carrier protein|uniref:Non-ribosomal peptide synthetase n=2 Tax=Planktothrix agardhii TaxID=1160 RepID=A0A073CGT7_PLAA1|nr:acyl carrier protein [Planktothrix agardhii]MCF3606702.1 acyl carrier protein [Planktothrix agardhii 1033]CAD5958242.1 Non-ribosomal peptide synthetase [Planktothrix rubescens]BBD56699.1 putative phosphopantetheine-binding protein [Planktothrix agardhii NIES-204]KEI67529.1 non-ribosomal peptide synthetase [Planktothrix agardhii NIVA-CYA 126/8]MCB8750910.1 acyl carrier protein [Planktothrix agardhii 1810]